jgi:hypothetical protein
MGKDGENRLQSCDTFWGNEGMSFQRYSLMLINSGARLMGRVF